MTHTIKWDDFLLWQQERVGYIVRLLFDTEDCLTASELLYVDFFSRVIREDRAAN
jgi:hypothetical protein